MPVRNFDVYLRRYADGKLFRATQWRTKTRNSLSARSSGTGCFNIGALFSTSIRNSAIEWYDAMARSRPPKDQPWYHVLVHGETHTTYVAERNLEDDPSGASIDHPAVDTIFAAYGDGRYIPTRAMN
jgi:hemimethylated DNA binding protein